MSPPAPTAAVTAESHVESELLPTRGEGDEVEDGVPASLPMGCMPTK
jgi:hypothetical protein